MGEAVRAAVVIKETGRSTAELGLGSHVLGLRVCVSCQFDEAAPEELVRRAWLAAQVSDATAHARVRPRKYFSARSKGRKAARMLSALDSGPEASVEVFPGSWDPGSGRPPHWGSSVPATVCWAPLGVSEQNPQQG